MYVACEISSHMVPASIVFMTTIYNKQVNNKKWAEVKMILL